MKLTHYAALILAVALAACDEEGAGDAGGDAAPLDLTSGDKTISPAPDKTIAMDAAAALDKLATKTDLGQVDGPLPTPGTVNVTTLKGKVMFGYQGWFGCPGDGSALNSWMHWFSSQTPKAASATYDLWPDMTELSAAERCPTQMTLPGGKPAAVFSAYRQATVARHFKWMKDNGLHGVFLQRFVSELSSPKHKAFRDHVAKNVMAGAEKHGRVFAVMYDIAGTSSATLIPKIKADWAHLVKTLKLTSSKRYLRHAGKPVLAVWGLGFTHTKASAAQAAQLISYLRVQAPAAERVTFIGGVPTHWRTLKGDARAGSAWAKVYKSMDVLSPWTVGRYGTEAGADNHRAKIITPDMADLAKSTTAYMPVVFPGFSWANLKPGATYNQIPRLGGAFFWRQAYNAMAAGAGMLYVAMFDEVDEGTAMFKMAPTNAQLPAQGSFVPLDADGYQLPADWYLKLAGAATRAMANKIPLTKTMPLTPKCGPAPHYKVKGGKCLPSCGVLLSSKKLQDNGKGCCSKGCLPGATAAGASFDCSVCCSGSGSASLCK